MTDEPEQMELPLPLPPSSPVVEFLIWSLTQDAEARMALLERQITGATLQ